jgi:hypothetical protein
LKTRASERADQAPHEALRNISLTVDGSQSGIFACAARGSTQRSQISYATGFFYHDTFSIENGKVERLAR